MITIEIPKVETLKIQHVLMDFNGTLATDGKLIEGVAALLQELSAHVELHVATADTNHSARAEFESLPVKLHIVENGEQKRDLLRKLGAHSVIAIGNGKNDYSMLEAAAFSIAVMGREGFWPGLLEVSSVAVTDIREGLQMILHPNRVIATLRT